MKSKINNKNKAICYKKELMNKVVTLQNEFKKKAIDILFNNDSFKNYYVKLVLMDKKNIFKGSLYLYYKPTTNTYSMKSQMVNSKIDVVINTIWNQINNFKIYSQKTNIYEAFVDGSYINGVTSYGAAVYLGDKIKAKIKGTILNSSLRQFEGELQSVMETLKWCHNNNIKKIRINYDYYGIEKFATGEWKAKNQFSKKYVNFINNTKIQIEWRYIKSHTGNIQNNMADILAKMQK
ncbi:MAG: reverse transcriptase-like protein [Endomicrobium sp.]|jgi:ribonuclease HI|nr:reverse transcriptase-like protein [Endomicrobium sp.]